MKCDITDFYNILQTRKNNPYICLDVNCMKKLNETYGFEAGNQALQTLEQTVIPLLSEFDIFFRIGGDEYVILLANNDCTYAKELTQRIQAKSKQTIQLPNNTKVDIEFRADYFQESHNKPLGLHEFIIFVNSHIHPY